jgi:hypothetical protein
VGAAGIVTAGVTGALLLSRDKKIKDHCQDKHCDSEGRDLIDGNKPLVIVNYVGWGVGVAGIGVGAFLLLTGRSQEKAPQTTVSATPLPGGAALGLARSF